MGDFCWGCSHSSLMLLFLHCITGTKVVSSPQVELHTNYFLFQVLSGNNKANRSSFLWFSWIHTETVQSRDWMPVCIFLLVHICASLEQSVRTQTIACFYMLIMVRSTMGTLDYNKDFPNEEYFWIDTSTMLPWLQLKLNFYCSIN